MLKLISVMLGTKRPQALATFYEKVLGKPPDMVNSEGSFFSWQLGSVFLYVLEHREKTCLVIVSASEQEKPEVRKRLDCPQGVRTPSVRVAVPASSARCFGQWICLPAILRIGVCGHVGTCSMQ